MKLKTIKLDADVRTVFLCAKIEGNTIQLVGQLERSLYVRVAKVIAAAGGKWNRAKGCHVFPHPVSETFNITDVTETGEVVDVQQSFQSFYTPYEIANKVSLLAEVESHHWVLEPSAGEGALLRALPRCYKIAVEINPRAAERLKGFASVIVGDFMNITPAELGYFDRIVMNPPFTGGQDIKHITHAYCFLKPFGRLVAICANTPKQKAALKELADQRIDEWIDVPAGAFKDSGTNIATAIVVITKRWMNYATQTT